jgi:hypothetical protein
MGPGVRKVHPGAMHTHLEGRSMARLCPPIVGPRTSVQRKCTTPGVAWRCHGSNMSEENAMDVKSILVARLLLVVCMTLSVIPPGFAEYRVGRTRAVSNKNFVEWQRVVDGVPVQLPLPVRAAHSDTSGAVYMLYTERGRTTRHWVTDPQTLTMLGFSGEDVSPMDPGKLARIPFGAPITRVGLFLKSVEAPEIYFVNVENGRLVRQHITASVWQRIGGNSRPDNLVSTHPVLVDLFPQGRRYEP